MKIVFTGPECTGKSTLSKWTAQKLNGHLCLEYARDYLSKKESYSIQDIEIIGRNIKKIWIENYDKNPLILDADFLVLKIWSEWKYNTSTSFINQEWLDQQFDLYFLCKPDIPWIYDPLRESEYDRESLYSLYISELNKQKRRYFVLSGDIENRKHKIMETIDLYKSTN